MPDDDVSFRALLSQSESLKRADLYGSTTEAISSLLGALQRA